MKVHFRQIIDEEMRTRVGEHVESEDQNEKTANPFNGAHFPVASTSSDDCHKYER